MEHMSKKLIFLTIFVLLMSTNVGLVSAQVATTSANSTSSATASNSATATSSTSTSTTSATTLPQTGAHDVLILFSVGVIFLIAGVTALSGTKQVFAELEEQTDRA